MAINRDLQELPKQEEEEFLTNELITYRELVFANRVNRSIQNQQFITRVFGENYSHNYSQLRKIEMHYLDNLSKGIRLFIDTIHGEHEVVADMLRMYYGFAEGYELPMSVEEIADEMEFLPEFVDEEIKRGHRMLRHPSRRYLFANHRQFDQYKSFHEELSNFIDCYANLFDKYDEFSDLVPTFTIKNRYEAHNTSDDVPETYNTEDLVALIEKNHSEAMETWQCGVGSYQSLQMPADFESGETEDYIPDEIDLQQIDADEVIVESEPQV